MRDFIIQRPDGQIREDHELPDFVMVREGEKGMHELDDATRHNEGYAQNYNDSQSHNAATLQAAFIASFTGNWGKIHPLSLIHI